MLTRLRNNLAEANYGALGLEVTVVIVGILIAFQIDRWAQEQREIQQEHQYVLRLKKDLQFEIAVMTDSLGTADQKSRPMIANRLADEALFKVRLWPIPAARLGVE